MSKVTLWVIIVIVSAILLYVAEVIMGIPQMILTYIANGVIINGVAWFVVSSIYSES